MLAVQGAFIEHERALAKLGCECVELRQGPDVEQPYDALVLPGGESTAQAKMLRELGMLDTLKSRVAVAALAGYRARALVSPRWRTNVEEGVPPPATRTAPLPAGATAAGAIGTLPVTVRRNAYGRQLEASAPSPRVRACPAYRMAETRRHPHRPSIRAPFIKEAYEGAEVLARADDRIVAVRSGNQLGVVVPPRSSTTTCASMNCL